MSRFSGIFLLLVTVALAGCGDPSRATLKGKLMNGSTPVMPDGQLVSLSFHPILADGKPSEIDNVFTAVLATDGTFEMVASGGTLPPGRYRVVVTGVASPLLNPKGKGLKTVAKPRTDRFASCSSLKVSKVEVTVNSGSNEVVVDIASATTS